MRGLSDGTRCKMEDMNECAVELEMVIQSSHVRRVSVRTFPTPGKLSQWSDCVKQSDWIYDKFRNTVKCKLRISLK